MPLKKNEDPEPKPLEKKEEPEPLGKKGGAGAGKNLAVSPALVILYDLRISMINLFMLILATNVFLIIPNSPPCNV